MNFGSLMYNSRTHIFFFLGIIQIMSNILPLFAYPWLGRILGPESFGLLMYMGLIPPIINILMDWGMQLGAVRAAVTAQKENRLGELVGAVFSAKTMLAFFYLLASIIFLPFLPHASDWPFAYFMAVIIGIFRGFSPLWYFQGTGKNVKLLACYDVGTTLLILILMVLFIREPNQWGDYLFFTALCKGGAWLFLDWKIWRANRASFSLKNGLLQLRQCNILFVSTIFNNIQIYGTQILLGFFLTSSLVGIYVAVSKMVRAIYSLSVPLSQTIFPQICNFAGKRKYLVRRILVFSLTLTVLSMGLATGLVWLFASFIIKISLGSSFEEAIPVLRIMIFALPLMSLNMAIGEQILVAMHLEKKQALALGIATSIGLCMAIFLVKGWQLAGVAWLPLIIESMLFITYSGIILKYGKKLL